MRTVVWFSCGATSAVAAKLALQDYPDAEVVRIVITSEHADSDRFANDVEKWLGKPIVNLHPKIPDHWEAIRYHRYINGPTGAKCTRELKQKVRSAYQRPDDLHVFGFDAGETDRVIDFGERNPDLRFEAPLVDAGLTKEDCLGVLERAGIELPAMYKLGYSNNNCVGCSKGGQAYWNKIRVDFPEAFAKMAALERDIQATVLRHRKGPNKGERLYLDELDPSAGRGEAPLVPDCGVLCEVALERAGL